jgi:hypothetical protein
MRKDGAAPKVFSQFKIKRDVSPVRAIADDNAGEVGDGGESKEPVTETERIEEQASLRLRKFTEFITAERVKAEENARQAYYQLRTRKRDVKSLNRPLMDETWGRSVTSKGGLDSQVGPFRRAVFR